jgi:hypothetical protein
LLPVSKTKPQASLRLAYAAGCRWLGENKVQEAFGKWESMQDLTDLHWSVIGHLQTNKARLVARFASEFQALDSLRVAEALDRHLQAQGRSLDVFVQVNTSGEASKYGLSPEAVPDFIQQLPVFSALRVRGLMTLALFSAEAERCVGASFSCVSCAISCGKARPRAWSWMLCRWGCPATSRLPSRRAPPWCAWGRPSSARVRYPIAITGQRALIRIRGNPLPTDMASAQSQVSCAHAARCGRSAPADLPPGPAGAAPCPAGVMRDFATDTGP